MNKLEAQLPALRECKSNAYKFVRLLWIHKIPYVTFGTSETPKFPEWIGTHFIRIAFLGNPQMYENDAFFVQDQLFLSKRGIFRSKNH